MQDNKDTIIFDLDGTLIKTERLKDAFKQIAIDSGCTSCEADEVYKSARTAKDKEGTERLVFSREHFTKVLKEFLAQKNIEVDEIDFSRLESELSEDILLPGAKELLEEAKKHGIKIILITLGEEVWQQEKLKASGLDKYFYFKDGKKEGNVIITDNNEKVKGRKMEALRSNLDKNITGEGVTFINDKPWETRDIAIEFPEMMCYAVPEHDDERYNLTKFDEAQSQAKEGGGKFERVETLEELNRRLFSKERYDGSRK